MYSLDKCNELSFVSRFSKIIVTIDIDVVSLIRINTYVELLNTLLNNRLLFSEPHEVNSISTTMKARHNVRSVTGTKLAPMHISPFGNDTCGEHCDRSHRVVIAAHR